MTKQTTIVKQAEGESLKSLLGQRVMLFCLNYIYDGTLEAITDTAVLLADPSIVYETGPFSQAGYKDAQKLHTAKWYVSRSAIESFGLGK
jgi:hypothetical protein